MWKKNDIVEVQDGREDIGFVAQELQHVLPEVVFGSNEGGYQVKYADIIALCIEGIKEQSQLLDYHNHRAEILELKIKEKGLI